MKRNHFQFLMGIILVMFSVITVGRLSQGSVSAQKIVNDESKATFMLMPELPKDNIGGNHLGYFNLKLSADKTRQIRIKVYNPTDKVLSITSEVKDATTDDNGGIDYLGLHKIDRNLLPEVGNDIVKMPNNLKLKPNETKWVTIKINPGKKLFAGQKLMALNLSSAETDTKSSINNKFVYAIGLVLNGTDLKKKEYKTMLSDGIKTRIIKDHKAAISIKLKNPDPKFLSNVKVTASLQNDKWHMIHYDNELKNIKIAPNSSFYDDLLLSELRLVPGLYKMTLNVKTDEYTKTIHKYVKITSSDASYINRNNYEYLKFRNIILGVLGGLILIIIVTWLLIRRKRKRRLNAKIS